MNRRPRPAEDARLAARAGSSALAAHGRRRPRASPDALLPYLDDIPELGDLLPSVGTVVIMIVYTMMAVGLNVVVGYAGLLDLGYVAFYAAAHGGVVRLGAVRAGDLPLRLGRRQPRAAGIHMSVWLILLACRCFTAPRRIIIGLPTLRLAATTSRS